MQWSINAVNVAVNWRLAPAEMEYTINDAEARVLIVGPDFFPHLAEIEGKLHTVKKIVALGENHGLQEFHDFVTSLLFDPGLPSTVTDMSRPLAATRASIRSSASAHMGGDECAIDGSSCGRTP